MGYTVRFQNAISSGCSAAAASIVGLGMAPAEHAPEEPPHAIEPLREPFRRILYPTMLRRIQRAWIAAYGPPRT